jgi:N-acetylmuramoyl-L-alanine amidase
VSGGARLRRRALLLTALIVSSALLVGLSAPASDIAPGSRLWWGVRNALVGPPRIGVQVGHLDPHAHPDELASLRWNTGGHAGGLDEVDVNRNVAEALAARLRALGVQVDLLPATVPPGYRADAVISIHADSSVDPERRGYKSAHFEPARNALEQELKRFVDAAYLSASGLPDDDRNTTGNMFHYYAFNHLRFEHSVARSTPALLVELGYLSHPDDRSYLSTPEQPAAAIAEGLAAYLRSQGRLAAP